MEDCIECPNRKCSHMIPESEWNHSRVVDYRCQDGHWLRIEGTSVEKVLFYEISPYIVERTNMN